MLIKKVHVHNLSIAHCFKKKNIFVPQIVQFITILLL